MPNGVTVDPANAVSLVVCTYTFDRLSMLRDLLDSVATGSRRPDETIVVIDREPVLEARLREELATRGVRVLGSPAGGLSAARNIGWRAAQGHWIAFVDDDAVVDEQWLERLVATAEAEGSAVAGGRIDPIWTGGDAPAWYTERLGWIVGCSFRGLPTRTSRVRSIIGCNMLLRRELLERLGGFALSLGREGGTLIGSEETELCIRAGRVGALVHFMPEARVWQIVPPQRRRLGYARRRAWGEGVSKARLAALHGPVLGVESQYTRELIVEAVTRLFRGRRTEVTRGAAQLTTLAITTSAYLVERLRLATRSAPS
jgi:GT2 family glycosyltransferase